MRSKGGGAGAEALSIFAYCIQYEYGSINEPPQCGPPKEPASVRRRKLTSPDEWLVLNLLLGMLFLSGIFIFNIVCKTFNHEKTKRN